MTPYYQDNHVTIYHGDCREIIPRLGNFDLIITDPPYNVGIDYGSGVNDLMNSEDWKVWASDWFWKCRSRSKTLLITGQPRLPDYAIIEPWKWLLCWWKPAAMGRSPVGFCNWEPIAMWGKGSSAGCDFVRAPILPDSSVDDHPCPKPLAWATGLLSLFPDSLTILDPFAGSGTIGRAAKDLNKKATLIEIQERYCEIAAQRMAQEILAL